MGGHYHELILSQSRAGTNLSSAAARKNAKSVREGAVLLLQEQRLPHSYSACEFSAFSLLFIFALLKESGVKEGWFCSYFYFGS